MCTDEVIFLLPRKEGCQTVWTTRGPTRYEQDVVDLGDRVGTHGYVRCRCSLSSGPPPDRGSQSSTVSPGLGSGARKNPPYYTYFSQDNDEHGEESTG